MPESAVASQFISTAASVTEPIRVIYVMGAGRSGSTVLDTVLGNHPDVISVGELSNLHRMGWTNGEYCACGERGNACEFWCEIQREWTARTGGARVAEYLDLQQAFEAFGPRQWLRAGVERFFRSDRFTRYLDLTEKLYEAICQVSGKRIVVDSSKGPLRAVLLSLLPGLDLRIVHLVRDGRAVVWSRKKALAKNERIGIQRDLKARSIWHSISFWIVVNLLSSWVRRRQAARIAAPLRAPSADFLRPVPAGSVRGEMRTLRSPPAKSVLVRYEDFVLDPERVLDQIAQMAELDYSEIARATVAGEPMEVGHTIAGSRVRMAGKIVLQPDWEWTQRLSPRDRRVCWALGGWLLKQYHYCRSVAVPSQPDHVSAKT